MPVPTDYDRLYELARTLVGRGEAPRAHALLSKAWHQGAPLAPLVAARLRLEAGEHDRAVAALSVVDREALDTPAQFLDDLDLALQLGLWARAVEVAARAPDTPALRRRRLDLATRLGRRDTARALVARIAAEEPPDLPWFERQLDHLLVEGDPASAVRLIDHLPLGLRALPTFGARRIEALISLGEPIGDAITWWLAGNPKAADQARAVGWWVAASEPEAAAALCERLLVVHPRSPTLRTWRARFALWRGDGVRAEGLADEALLAGGGPTALRTLAAAQVLTGRAQRALATLDTLLADHPDDRVARTWRGEALRALGRYEDGAREADRAVMGAPGVHLSGRVLRALACLENPAEDAIKPDHLAEDVAEPLTIVGQPPAPLLERLTRAHRALGGNRTETPTTVVRGRLVGHPFVGDFRTLGRTAQHQLRSRAPRAVLDRLDALLEQHPHHPVLLAHRGEVHLWLGELEAAAADCRAAVERDPTTKWAWVGLGAAQLFSGDLEGALHTFDLGDTHHPVPAPPVFVYRAEAHWRARDLPATEAALRRSLAVSPKRLSAWMLAALVDAEQGELAPAAALLDLVRARLPGLVLDTDAPDLAPPDHLQRMLDAFGPNRASTLLTWRAAGCLRVGMAAPLPEPVRAAFPRWWRDGRALGPRLHHPDADR